jgi:transcriptional regulator with XRE-family HTH domain
MTINERVRELRHELKLSQVKFAEAISASSGYIAGIEVGNRKVNDRIIRLICVTFNASEEWLRTGEGDMFNKSPSRMTELACATFQELKPEYQEYVLKQIDLLLEIQNKETGE